jgi:hypothetical protein
MYCGRCIVNLMNRQSIDLEQPDVLSGLVCATCFSPTRLTGVEPHATQPHTDLWTFQCTACDAVQAIVVPGPH